MAPILSSNSNVKLHRYQDARKALHSNCPDELPAREQEIDDLKSFIKQHLINGTSGSLYISGPPGTGKTASLTYILEQDESLRDIKYIYINCTAIKSARSIYARLTKELHIKTVGKSEKDHLKAVENYLKKKHKTLLIILDEIDQLETKNHSVLYTIFEWPSKPSSNLILIGIANALDLTDRILPLLQSRCELKPYLLHFPPYTKEQIIKIFTSRLESAGILNIFSPVAIQMLAAKVASVSGDIRRALDIGRRVVELVENNNNENVLESIENFTSDLQQADNQLQTVNLKEVSNALNNIYGTTQNLNNSDIRETFPLQQKIVICCLLSIRKKSKINRIITMGKLHENYMKTCDKMNLMAIDQSEFAGLCSLIETRGIIKIVKKKEPRLSPVTLEWNETEVVEALEDQLLMAQILNYDFTN